MGAILDLPCPSVILWLWFCHSVTFQMKIFVTLFSGTVRPRRLKLGTHVDSGQMYRVYRNQAAALIHPFYSSFFFLSNFQTLKYFVTIFSELWGLEDWNLAHTWTVGRCIMYTGIRLLLLIHPFILHYTFSPIFKHWNLLSHFSQELWGLEVWNMVHTWTVGRCIVYIGIELLLLIRFFFIELFCHTFLRNYEA